MEWNAKTSFQWDWETLALFSEKECEFSEPVEVSHCRIDDEMNISNGSVHSSRGAFSGSDLGNIAAKGSVSGTTDSLTKLGGTMLVPNLGSAGQEHVNQSNNRDVSKLEDSGTSSGLDSPNDPVICLKLGKRTYFEDVVSGSSIKSPSSATTSSPVTALVKKSRASQQSSQSFHCQVEGCEKDLSTAKEYHRKHQICESHSKSPKVVVAGQERRFCQQCSRFHHLSEFDLNKRSCRRRLSDHNARRRKPQPRTISFSSSVFPQPYYDNKQPTKLVFGGAPVGHISNISCHALDFSGRFNHDQINRSNFGGNTRQQFFSNNSVPNNFSAVNHGLDNILPFKNSSCEVKYQGPELPAVLSKLDGAPEPRCAFSLLSSDSYYPAKQSRGSVIQSVVDANSETVAHPSFHLTDATAGLWH